MIGIAGIGVSLPELVSTWDEIAPVAKVRESLKDFLGCNYVPLAKEDESPSYFSLQAAQEALQDANVAPEEVDVVISNSMSNEYWNWQSSAHVADQLGCRNATTFDVYGGCNTTGIAYHMAVDMMKDDEDINTVLIAMTEHLGGGTFPQFIGDGACSIVLKRGHQDLVHVEYLNLNETMPVLGVMNEGGVVHPYTPETRFDGSWQDNVEFNVDKYRKEIKPIFAEMTTKPMFEVCAKAGLKPTDLDMFFMVHQQMAHNQKVTELLGLPLSKSPTHYIENLGHISGFDVFIALKWAMRDGLVKKGDLMGFLIMGLGEWHGLLIRY